MAARQKIRVMLLTTIIMLAIGLAASAQNLVVFGTTTGQGSTYIATTAGSSVGVGTTTPNTSAKLDVVGYTRLGGGIAESWFPYTDNNAYLSGANIYFRGTTAQGNPAWASLINGNLGVGTGTPAYKVDVNGSFRANGSFTSYQVSGSGSALDWTTGTSNTDVWRWYFNGTDNNSNIGTRTLQLWAYPYDSTGGCCHNLLGFNLTDNHAWFSGNLGIGTQTPAARLDVQGDFYAQRYFPRYAAWGTTTGDGGAAIVNDNTTYKTLMIVGNSSGGGTRQVSLWDQLNVNGNVVVNGTVTTTGGTALQCTTALCGSTAGAACVATCPAGYAATGGGMSLSGYEDSQQTISEPSGGTGWYCYSSRHPVTCFAQCCH